MTTLTPDALAALREKLRQRPLYQSIADAAFEAYAYTCQWPGSDVISMAILQIPALAEALEGREACADPNWSDRLTDDYGPLPAHAEVDLSAGELRMLLTRATTAEQALADLQRQPITDADHEWGLRMAKDLPPAPPIPRNTLSRALEAERDLSERDLAELRALLVEAVGVLEPLTRAHLPVPLYNGWIVEGFGPSDFRAARIRERIKP